MTLAPGTVSFRVAFPLSPAKSPTYVLSLALQYLTPPRSQVVARAFVFWRTPLCSLCFARFPPSLSFLLVHQSFTSPSSSPHPSYSFCPWQIVHFLYLASFLLSPQLASSRCLSSSFPIVAGLWSTCRARMCCCCVCFFSLVSSRGPLFPFPSPRSFSCAQCVRLSSSLASSHLRF